MTPCRTHADDPIARTPGMLGSLAAGVSCCTNWMLEPRALGRPHPSPLRATGRRRARADAWLRHLGEACDHPWRSCRPGVRILSVQMPGGAPLADLIWSCWRRASRAT